MLHLFHPAFVHFALAFLVAGACVEAFGLLARRREPARFGQALVLLGTVSLLPAIVTGYVAANTVDVPESATRLLAIHERNGWLVLGLMVAALFWKAWTRGELPGAQRPLYAVLLLLVAAFTVYSGYLGAEMVYRHAVGVG